MRVGIIIGIVAVVAATVISAAVIVVAKWNSGAIRDKAIKDIGDALEGRWKERDAEVEANALAAAAAVAVQAAALNDQVTHIGESLDEMRSELRRQLPENGDKYANGSDTAVGSLKVVWEGQVKQGKLLSAIAEHLGIEDDL